MFGKFFPGKLACFAVLTLFVFIPVRSGSARVQENDRRLFSSIIVAARNLNRWSDCQYRDGNLLECHPENFSVFPVSASKTLGRPLKQSGVTLTATGRKCKEQLDNGQPAEFCNDLTFSFDPAGGDITGKYISSAKTADLLTEEQGTIVGFFTGGDGGKISGLLSGQYTTTYYNGEPTATGTTDLSLDGILHANGTGGGMVSSGDFGEWSVTFDAAAFQNALKLVDNTPVVPPSPDPYIDPNPNPDPNPVPSPIDPETISILQSILDTPVLPITGAVAGGLVAWIISMLGGSRPVLPAPPRPSTRGIRPGQMGPDGKVWSPQGWVSKATYDYQQKWLQKGWRLNSQTGNLEVQPGAVNESGQVWYKLPYDEGNSHYWVDKAKVDECERNMAEGYVYDHGQGGWIKSDDLGAYNAQRKAWEDQNLSPEARQRAHDQLMQQVQDGMAQDAQYQKIMQDIQQAQDQLNAISRQTIQSEMAFNQRMLELNQRTLRLAEIVGGPLNSMKKAADTTMDILGGIPGPPTYIRYAYKAVTGFADKAFTDRKTLDWVMGLRKYGWLAEIKEVTDEGYYRYEVAEREGS